MVEDVSLNQDETSSLLLDKLRDWILSGTVEPGESISESGLAERFHVSRTPIRESLKQLQSEGLVEIRPKVGTFIREPSRREVLELFELKEVLEGMAARLMALRGWTPELELLEGNVAASEVAVRQGDTEAYERLVHEFHETLVAGADNRKLTEHYRTLMNQLAYHRLVRKTVQRPGRLPLSAAEHRRVFELIREKDAFEAERAMRDHVALSAKEAVAP